MNSSRKLICKFFKLHNLILCTCYKVCGIHKIKVVLSTRRNLPTPPSPCRITFIVTVTEFHGDSSVGTHTHSQLASHTSHLRPFSRPSATLTQVHSRPFSGSGPAIPTNHRSVYSDQPEDGLFGPITDDTSTSRTE